jgi:hypothetical protein
MHRREERYEDASNSKAHRNDTRGLGAARDINLVGFDTHCSDTLVSAEDAAESNMRVENPASRLQIAPTFGPNRRFIGQVDVNGVKGNIVDGLSGTLVSASDVYVNCRNISPNVHTGNSLPREIITGKKISSGQPV